MYLDLMSNPEKMRPAVFVTVALFVFVSVRVDAKIHTDLANRIIYRQGKFFGIGLVRFQNGVCPSQDGYDGTCYTKRQCSDINGSVSGTCASNIGVCCVVQGTCGGSSSYNNTYFSNPGYPSTYTGGMSCVFTIVQCNSNICQVRIDLLNFILAQPNANGQCVYDSMSIVGGGANIPTLCGDNSGQHLYVDFNGNQDIRIIISTSADLALQRSWQLKISQIACDCPTLAPSGCLQYYTTPTGTVRSFNYGKTTSSGYIIDGQPGTRELANLNYGICVEPLPGYCGITWSPSSGVYGAYSFTVSGSTTTATGDGTVGTPAAALNGIDCTTDFIVVPNPSTGGVPTNTDRFCGNYLPPLTTYSKPFVLTVVNNGDDSNDSGNRGFSISYSEVRCNASSYVYK